MGNLDFRNLEFDYYVFNRTGVSAKSSTRSRTCIHCLVLLSCLSVYCPYCLPQAGDLLGATWHFLGQGVFIRLVAASSRLVGFNVLEANGILLGMSCLGNAVAGSRLRCLTGTGKYASDVSGPSTLTDPRKWIGSRERKGGRRRRTHVSCALTECEEY